MTSALAELAELSGIDEAALARLGREDLLFLKWQISWLNTARENQVPPDTDWTECGFQAGRGFGKRLAADTPLPTLSGWIDNGDVKVGDTLLDECSEPCNVTDVHPLTVPERMYRVSFSDGAFVDADAEHLWAYVRPGDYPAPNWACRRLRRKPAGR